MTKNPLKIAVFCNPLETLNTKKDSTLAMMDAICQLGHALFYGTIQNIFANSMDVFAHLEQIEIQLNHDHLNLKCDNKKIYPLSEFDIILMRQDPPVDASYWHFTQLLSLVEEAGVLVANPTTALRKYNEKLATLLFPELAPPLLVTYSLEQLFEFLNEHENIVCKPLHAMGGSGVFHIKKNDPNMSEVMLYLTQQFRVPLMAQRYLPDIIHGDKRILIINGEVMPKALNRVPREGDWRGNLAQGARGIVQALSDRDWIIASTIAAFAKSQKLSFVGIDVIGNYLTEINITSPTGLREIQTAVKENLAEKYISGLMSFLRD